MPGVAGAGEGRARYLPWMQIVAGETVARLGYWRVGGPIDRLVIVEQAEELRGLAFDHVLGNGSNLLAPDAGLRGTTIRLNLRESALIPAGSGEALAAAVAEGAVPPEVAAGLSAPGADPGACVLIAGAGLLNAALLGRIGRAGVGGLGCLAGVPGTVGGAVAMNAGTALGEVSGALLWVDGFGDGAPRRLLRADLPMRYREGGLPPGFVVSAAGFLLSATGAAEEQARVRHHLERRRATQPLDLPSCGSVFRNPPGDHAGRLIESVGLKGFQVGGAQISPRHANFIVNLGGATASDVMACVREAWGRVRAEAGVTLVPEVHVIGEWPAGVWPLVG